MQTKGIGWLFPYYRSNHHAAHILSGARLAWLKLFRGARRDMLALPDTWEVRRA